MKPNEFEGLTLTEMKNKIMDNDKLRQETAKRIAEFFSGDSTNPIGDTYKKLIDFENAAENNVVLADVMDMLKTIKSTVDKINSNTKKRDFFGGPG